MSVNTFNTSIVVVIIAVCIYLQSNSKNSTYNGKSTRHNKKYKKMGDEEIFDDKGMQTFCQQLWESDTNFLQEDADYELDLGGKARWNGGDSAEDPLFTFVTEAAFQRPTYRAFISLLDNYESDTGVPETVTPQEEAENRRFLDLIFQTKPIELAYKFLKYRGKIDCTPPQFKHELYNLWFKLYRRTRATRQFDSSGFEHVFVGETRGETEVIGFHNWIQFYLQEKKGNVDYRGFMSYDKNAHLKTIQFSWKEEMKPKGSMFIGTSPEFEMALYTVCFLMGHDAYRIYLDDDEVIIKCHKTAGKIGTCYPQLPNKRY